MLRCTLVQTGTVRVGGCEIDAIDRCDRSPHARVQAEAQGACCARVQVLARSRRRAFLRGGEHFVVLFLPLAGPLLFAILFVGWPFAFCLCAVSSASLFIRGLYCIEQLGMMPSLCRIAGQYKNCKPEISSGRVASCTMDLLYGCGRVGLQLYLRTPGTLSPAGPADRSACASRSDAAPSGREFLTEHLRCKDPKFSSVVYAARGLPSGPSSVDQLTCPYTIRERPGSGRSLTW